MYKRHGLAADYALRLRISPVAWGWFALYRREGVQVRDGSREDQTSPAAEASGARGSTGTGARCWLRY